MFYHKFLYMFKGLHPKRPWGPSLTLKLFVPIQSCYMRSYIILGSIVFELHDMRMICLLKAVTPAWVRNTVSFTLQIDYTHYSGPFEVLQAKVKCLLSVGPVRPVPRALNKHYSARGGSINVSFMYIT